MQALNKHAHEAASSGNKGRSRKSILLAEDEPAVRESAILILEDAGFTVFSASDGVEAIQVFDAHADEIDLAILDVVMPRKGGKAVCEYIRDKCPNIPVLYSSGYYNNDLQSGDIANGHLLQKPYTRQSLLTAIGHLLNRKRNPETPVTETEASNDNSS